MEYTIVLYCCLECVLAENAKKYEIQPKRKIQFTFEQSVHSSVLVVRDY